jgi:hypothetical protein
VMLYGDPPRVGREPWNGTGSRGKKQAISDWRNLSRVELKMIVQCTDMFGGAIPKSNPKNLRQAERKPALSAPEFVR